MKDELNTKNNLDLDIPQTLRSEFHFLKFPFFDLCPRLSKKDRIEIKEIGKTKDVEIEIVWRVVRSIDSDFPSSFARKIHRKVIEKTMNNFKKPIPRLLRLGSLWQICKKADLVPSGKIYKEIRKALKDIKTATIEAKGTFRQKEKNGTTKFFEGIFNLYDMVFFTGETLPNGGEADAVYVLLNDMYVQNFNNNFVVPLDYQYLQSLKGDITSRMYEMLSIWLYPALSNGKDYIQKKYSEICNYFPLTRQNIRWRARGQLKSAHQQHIANGFLASEPEWIDTNEKDDWLIRYYIGPKAKDWYRQNKRLDNINKDIKQIENGYTVTKINNEKLDQQKIEDQYKDNPLFSKLLSLDIPVKKSATLIENYPPDMIELWIDAVSTIKLENPAGFLIHALEEGYALPMKFKKKIASKEKEKEKEQKLKDQYNKFLIAEVDAYLSKIDKAIIDTELEQHKKKYLEAQNLNEEFITLDHWMPYIESDYKREKAKTIDILSFNEWKKEYK